ncbi:MAG: cytochrome c oxidase subunit II [Planctomycetota bacterium]|jgi:cytochrome c oxidase subunit 2
MIRRLTLMLMAVVATLAFGAGVAHASDGYTLWDLSPEGISTYAGDVDHLYRVILWLITGTFVITQGLLLWFLFKYRAKPGGKAVYTHGNHKLEVIWTIIPGALLFWLALYQIGTWRDIKILTPPAGEGPVVQVLARQFEWHFRYTGPDGEFGTDDDVTTLNYLHVPKGKKVTLQIRGQDVLHSFFVPALRLKQDTVPGLTIAQWFEATKSTEEYREIWRKKLEANRRSHAKVLARQSESGSVTDDEVNQWIETKVQSFNFEIACAELCGAGHTRMRGFMVVHEEDAYWKWMNEAYIEIREYGVDEETPFFAEHEGGDTYWPQSENDKGDPWTEKAWPADLKKAWPKEGE